MVPGAPAPARPARPELDDMNMAKTLAAGASVQVDVGYQPLSVGLSDS